MSEWDNSVESSFRGLKLGHLRLLAELRAVGRLGQAADRLGLQQPAASRLLSELEEIVGHPIREREGRILRLTNVGEALARRAERVFLELKDAARDIAEAAAGNTGHIRIGSVTGPAISHLLPALRELREQSPNVTAEVVVSTSDQLCEGVLSGQLDFALGRIPPNLTDRLSIRSLGTEPLGLVVRRGHPLLMQSRVDIEDLRRFDWVMSSEETLLAQTVLRWWSNAGYPPPTRWISTMSFLFTLAVLRETDAISPLALPVVQSFTDGVSMPFVQVPFDMGTSVEAFGIVCRKDMPLPPAVERVIAMIFNRV